MKTNIQVRWLIVIVVTCLLSLMFIKYLQSTHLNNSKFGRSINTFNSYLDSKILNKYSHFQTSPPKTDISYESAQKNIESHRKTLATSYKTAKDENEKSLVLSQAREQFVTSITTLLPYWYGTPWDFNGTSNTPQQGSIACGYYVTTLLEDNGLHVERNKLAQQASENIIKSLTSESHIKRFSNRPLVEFIDVIETWGEGLYIVGLDSHVGYIWHDGTDIHFIHSTITGPKSAFAEPAQSSKTLDNSKYRVLGKISEDDDFILNWLQQQKILTRT